MNPPRIFNAVFEPITIRLDSHHPNGALQFEFELLTNAAVILGDIYFLADLETRLYHKASRVEDSNFITTRESNTLRSRSQSDLKLLQKSETLTSLPFAPK
jgi:hypothetical protein